MLHYFLLMFFTLGCSSSSLYGQRKEVNVTNTIECSEDGCSDTYYCPEFINGSDVAHQFTNTMSHKLGR